MFKEKLISISAWVTLSILLIWLVPQDKIREAMVIFFFKQVLTWLFGTIVVDKNLIEFPVRLFPRASNTSFTFDYFAYPAICVFFNLYYPFGESMASQLLHYVLYSSGITLFEVILERHTNLIKYIRWKWYWTWITLTLTFMMSNYFYRWFFNF